MRKILLILFLSVLWCGSSFAAEVKRFQIPLENSPVIGPETAVVTIIEFIDYQ